MKKHHHNFILGCCITGVMLLLIVVGAFWTPYDAEAMDTAAKMQAPSLAHLLGTDNFGRDILSRVLEGAGTTLFIAVSAVCAGLFFGILIGAFTGWYGGWIDEVLMRIADVITAFPSILLALVLISLLGSELHIVEVKSRVAPVMAEPEQNVRRDKQRRMVAAANAFLHSTERKELPADLEIIFDVLSVVFYGTGADFAVDYFPKAFIPLYA